MKKIWVVVFIGFVASVVSAQASLKSLDLSLRFNYETSLNENLNCGDDCESDRFAQLEKLYNSSVVPAQSSLVGWFSGRCFWATNKSLPRNIVFLGWTEITGEDDGPLFPPREAFKALWAEYHGKPANYTDVLTPELETELNRYFEIERSHALEVTKENAALLGGLTTTPVKWYMRQSGNYTVMQSFQFDQVQAYCYTFTKLK